MKAWIKNARADLVHNSSISNVNDKQISFTNEFKEKAIEAYKNGKSPAEIFSEAGLDPKLFPRAYCSKSIRRWTSLQQQHGKKALTEERRGKGSTGRPKGKSSPKKMTQSQIEARLAYLEAENDFLKKLHALAKQGK